MARIVVPCAYLQGWLPGIRAERRGVEPHTFRCDHLSRVSQIRSGLRSKVQAGDSNSKVPRRAQRRVAHESNVLSLP